jgi:hypothetical protein
MFRELSFLTFGISVLSAIFIGMVIGYQLKYMGEKKSDDIVPAGTKVRFKTKVGHWSYGIVLEDIVEGRNQFVVIRNVEWKLTEDGMAANEGYRIFPVKVKEDVEFLGTGEWTTTDYCG